MTTNKVFNKVILNSEYGVILPTNEFILYDPNRFSGIENTPIIDDEKNSSEYLIKAVFEIYVDTGIYAGTLREYIGSVDDLVDIKSGKTKKEIMSKTYTISEYKNKVPIKI